MSDYIVRKRHNTSPVITAGLGRLLSGAAMMGAMMKGDDDLLTLQIKCGGPVQGLTATADAKETSKAMQKCRMSCCRQTHREN